MSEQLPDNVRFQRILSDQAIAMPAQYILQGVLIVLDEPPIAGDPPLLVQSFSQAAAVAKQHSRCPISAEEARNQGWRELRDKLRSICERAARLSTLSIADKEIVLDALYKLGRTGPALSATLFNGFSTSYIDAVLYKLHEWRHSSSLGAERHARTIEALNLARKVAGACLMQMNRYQVLDESKEQVRQAWQSVVTLEPSYVFAAGFSYFAATGEPLSDVNAQ